MHIGTPSSCATVQYVYSCGIQYQTFLQKKSQHSFLAHLFSELATRKYLDKYLASAFNLSLEGGKLKAVDDHMYVLTLDYTLKVCMYMHVIDHLVLSTALCSRHLYAHSMAYVF